MPALHIVSDDLAYHDCCSIRVIAGCGAAIWYAGLRSVCLASQPAIQTSPISWTNAVLCLLDHVSVF